MEANELAESRAALLALQALDPSIHVTCNLGLVARRLSLWIEAAENLSGCVRAFAAVPPAPPDIPRYDQLRAELAMARAMVASVVILTPPGARVTIGETILTSVTPERELFLDPGSHVVEVAGHRRQVDLRPGSKTLLDFVKPPPRPPEGVDGLTFTGFVIGTALAAGGGGLLAVSEIYRATGTSRLSTLEQADGRTCAVGSRNATTCSALTREINTSTVLRSISFGTLALSGAVLAGSVVYGKKPPQARVLVGLGGAFVEAAW